jgi:hypothetical protein
MTLRIAAAGSAFTHKRESHPRPFRGNRKSWTSGDGNRRTVSVFSSLRGPEGLDLSRQLVRAADEKAPVQVGQLFDGFCTLDRGRVFF